jgi:hypothetical protein
LRFAVPVFEGITLFVSSDQALTHWRVTMPNEKEEKLVVSTLRGHAQYDVLVQTMAGCRPIPMTLEMLIKVAAGRGYYHR